MSNILNAVTGREKFFIQGDGVYSSVTGAKIGIIENGVVKSSATGNEIAIVNSSSDDGGIDLSFVTAGASDILSGAVGADRNGSPVYGSISKKNAATYTPSTSNQTIAAGLYLSGVQTIKGDSNLAAANIRAGKSIFGKAGSFTSDATATAEDILEGKTAGVNGTMITGSLKPSSGGIEFYECSSYTPNFAGGLEYSFTLSGAPEDVANGTYKRTKWVENPTEEWSDTPLAEWVNEKGCKLKEFYYSEYSYSIVGPSGILYEPDSPYWTRLTDYNQISWVDSEYWEPVSLTFSPWQTSELPPTVESWSGYKVMQDTETGAWSKSDTLTEDLTVEYLTPKVGDIYSADTSIRVRKMYDGATYPITSDGLVFYAPLATDYVDQITGKAAPVTGGTFTTHNGLSCLQLDGSEYVKWADNADLPVGDVPYSFVVLIASTNNNDWRCYMSMGHEGSDEIAIHAKGGRLEEFASANIKSDGTWQALALTRDASGGAKTYINGKLDGSGPRPNAVPTPSAVCVGGQVNSFSQLYQGYIAFAAVYNRELSADEVAEIHAALMADVEQ